MAPVIILILITLGVILAIYYKRPIKKVVLSANFRELLSDYVVFYYRLNETQKRIFERKIEQFLGYVRIEGIGIKIVEIDRLLIASSAIIPIFYFADYKYFNLKSVLLYPGTFNQEEFLSEGYEKNTLGMVGTGPMEGSMILSRIALFNGFENKEQPYNTGIHEFVHLMDKEDGAVDGLPEILLQKRYNQKWEELVIINLQKIQNGESDISSYAATNRAEFFSVVSEYFFNSPHIFKEKHTDLYNILCKMYQVPKNIY